MSEVKPDEQRATFATFLPPELPDCINYSHSTAAGALLKKLIPFVVAMKAYFKNKGLSGMHFNPFSRSKCFSTFHKTRLSI